jgi:hypothetical protein
MMLVLQLGRLDLLKLLRQSRHDERGRRGEEEFKRMNNLWKWLIDLESV